MLIEMRLENYAVIDNLVVEFGPGLNLLTGETGAGKSILVDALALLLGDKASSDVIRDGTERAMVSALFEAELSECSMGGNLCGVSTGEALSRWCAAVISNNALSDFATAPQWAQDGEPDYVNQTDPTDQSADSTGCGISFAC